MGVGMPEALKLEMFGELLFQGFGHVAYHVGSSLASKSFRDVDVRLMLPDDEYEKLGLGNPSRPHSNPKWVAMCLAFTALAREMTGLPIDFQIQQVSAANAEFSGPRSALLRFYEERTAEDAVESISEISANATREPK